MAFKVILLTGLAVSLIPLLYAGKPSRLIRMVLLSLLNLFPAKKHKPKPPPPQPPPAWCYVCEDDLLPERMRCTHVRPRHLQQCPPGVYQCYIQVNSVLSFRRGCAYPNNTIYQECVARQMDKCIVCEFDKCNSFSIVNELSNFYCIQKVGKTIINAPCSDSVNLLTLPNSCLAQYNAEGLALTKCVTEKLLPNYIPSYSTFEYECTGYDCQWMNSEMSCLVDNPEPGKQPCIAYKKSTIVGCYKIDGMSLLFVICGFNGLIHAIWYFRQTWLQHRIDRTGVHKYCQKPKIERVCLLSQYVQRQRFVNRVICVKDAKLVTRQTKIIYEAKNR